MIFLSFQWCKRDPGIPCVLDCPQGPPALPWVKTSGKPPGNYLLINLHNRVGSKKQPLVSQAMGSLWSQRTLDHLDLVGPALLTAQVLDCMSWRGQPLMTTCGAGLLCALRHTRDMTRVWAEGAAAQHKEGLLVKGLGTVWRALRYSTLGRGLSSS